ncbi:MAG: glycosyl hydrolase [Polyangiales bacterium]
MHATGGGGALSSDAGAAGSGGTGPGSGGHPAVGGTAGAAGTTGAAGVAGAAASDAGTHAGAQNDAGTSSGPLLGVYCGNSVADVQQFETWLGRPVDGILGYTGNASWSDYDGSVGWAVGLWGAIDRKVFWSVPLIPTGATLADAAKGSYDDHYRKAAMTLSTYRPQDGKLNIRTGWEFNGDWFPWTAKGGKAQDFVGAFQHFVTAFRSVSDRFVIEWNVNVGDQGMNPEDAYPGDAYVDVIGMDFYWNTQWDPKDQDMAWSYMVSRTYGLQWHQDFAAKHGKPTSYSEWGINSDGPSYIANAKNWFDTHPVLFHTYWNSNTSFTGKLSDGQYPNAGAKYKMVFSGH